MKIVLAGGTGFIGRALRRELLSAGHELVVLTRGKNAEAGRERFMTWDGPCPRFFKKIDKCRPNSRCAEIESYWDGKTLGEWAAYLDGADAVINLVGENIAAGRWTVERKARLLSSRVDATRVIITAIEQSRKKPAVLINASAVGYYGDVPERELTESSGKGEGFLAEICEQWESEARKAESCGTRVILARLGPVLGEKGGMLSKMLPPFRFFMGAPLGTGGQWIPWIHREDVIRIFLFMLERWELSGPVNVTSPAPTTMKDFSLELARALRRPCGFPVPSFLLSMLLGERAAIVLAGQRALPQKLLAAGYAFRYASLRPAFESILKKRA